MLRPVLAALLCRTAAALLAPATPPRRSVERHGFFDDLQKGMDNLIVSDLDKSRQGEPQLPPEQDERDPVEKLFGFFFGEVEAAPMGMTRMSVETNPDQYPAETTGESNPAVAGDDEDLEAWVRPVMLQTTLAQRKMYEVYDSSQDGWTPQAFHDAVDKRGPGVVLATSLDGQKFGGYNSKGWVGLGEDRSGISNFLFAWREDGGFIKLPKVGGAGMGVVDKPEKGPMFGPEGLSIPLFTKSPRRARCKLGPYYQRMPSGSNTMLPGGEGEVALSRFQVFVGDWGGEPIPFDDAMPFSLT
jgi:hypothetical protein